MDKKFRFPLAEPFAELVVIYARFSSSKQNEQSIEAQLRACHAYAEQRGWRVVGEYCDRAISGREAESRPEFQRMIRDAKKGVFSAVIVWKLDRFSRNRYDSVIYKHQLKQAGVRVFSATEPVGEGSESAIVEAILEAMAEEYSRALAQNVTRGMRESARNGRSTGGTIALGYCIKDKRLAVVEPEARTVRRIFELYAQGMGKKELAAQLAAEGHRGRSGGPFTISGLTRILGNPKYKGVLVYDDIVVEGGCPAIVSVELWEQAQRRAQAARRAPGRAKAHETYLLTGKAFCGHCGAPLVGESGKGRHGTVFHYYACAAKKKTHTCTKANEKKDWLEAYAVDQALAYVLAPERLPQIAKAVAAEYAKGADTGSVAALERELRKLDKELDACVDAMLRTTVQRAVDKLNERMAAIEAQRADLEAELAGARLTAAHPITAPQVEAWLKTFCTGSASDTDFRRRIIDVLINAIYIFDDKIITYYNTGTDSQVSHSQMLESLSGSDFSADGSPNIDSSEPLVFFTAGVLGLFLPRMR